MISLYLMVYLVRCLFGILHWPHQTTQFLSFLPGCTYMLPALIVEVALLFQSLLFIGFCNLLKPFQADIFPPGLKFLMLMLSPGWWKFDNNLLLLVSWLNNVVIWGWNNWNSLIHWLKEVWNKLCLLTNSIHSNIQVPGCLFTAASAPRQSPDSRTPSLLQSMSPADPACMVLLWFTHAGHFIKETLTKWLILLKRKVIKQSPQA